MGLKFVRVDLHVHTPASKDFKNPNNQILPKDIVKKALERGLKAIAITDHNTNLWIDDVKKTAKRKGLIVFPGVELNVIGGERGIHLLAIFDPCEKAQKIEDLWNILTMDPEDKEIRKGFHQQDTALNCSPHEAYRMIEKLGGICIPAHATSSKGILHEMKGLPRKQFFSSNVPLVVEARDWNEHGDFIKKKPALELLNGEDPNYNYCKAAIIQGSDCIDFSSSDEPDQDHSHSHSLDHIGKRFTFFKLSEEITLEALKQCFYDHELRIRQQFEDVETQFPQLLAMEIIGGFLDNSTIIFNSGLNAIIGGKGAGKSLIIEFLRNNLENMSVSKSLQDDNLEKLYNQLKPGGQVSVIFQTHHRGIYRNTLRINEYKKLERECKRIEYNNGEFYETDELFEGNIPQLFPISAFSQTEIVKIVESPEYLRDILDRFIDQRSLEEDIKNLKYKISESDHVFQGLLVTHLRIIELNKRIATLEAQKADILRKLSSEHQEKLRRLEQDNHLFRNWKKDYEKVSSQLEEIKEPFIEILNAEDLVLVNSSTLRALLEVIEKIKDNSMAKFTNFIHVMKGLDQQVEITERNWIQEYQQQKTALLEYFGDEIVNLEQELEKTKNLIDELSSNRREEMNRERGFKDVLAQREKLLTKLYERKNRRTHNRLEIAQQLTKETDELVKVNILVDSDTSDLEKCLEELRIGTRIGRESVPVLASVADGRELAKLFKTQNTKKLAEITELEEERFVKWITFIKKNENWDKVLKLEHRGLKNDIPQFFYQENQEYKELKYCSVGQKATAVLALILSQSKIPLIIDQPEDALDLSTIYNDIVFPIRQKKEFRQFILTSHSSELVVGADADSCLFLKADADSTQIIGDGVIEQKDIRENLLKYLEGGRPLFEVKLKKYGYR